MCVFLALDKQHATRVRCIISLCDLSDPVPYSSTLSRKLHDFWKEVVENKIVMIFVRSIIV